MIQPATLTIPSRNDPSAQPRRGGERSLAFLDVLDQKSGGVLSAEPASPAAPGKVRPSDAQDKRGKARQSTTSDLNPTSMARAQMVSPAAPGASQTTAEREMATPASAGRPAPAPDQGKPAAILAQAAPESRDTSAARPPATPAAPNAPTTKPASPQPTNSAVTASPDQDANSAAGTSSRAAPATPAATTAAASPASAEAAESEPADTPSITGISDAPEAMPKFAQGADRAPKLAPKLPEEPHARFTVKTDDKLAAQAAKGLAAALRQGGGSVTMRLHPEDLGELRVRVEMAGGHVGASFQVGNAQAQRLLGKTLDDLRSALEARGLSVDRLDVHLTDHAGHTPDQAGRDGGANHSFGGADHRGGAGPEAHTGGGQSWAGQERPTTWWGGGAAGTSIGTEWTPPDPLAVNEPAPHGALDVGRGLVLQPGGAPQLRVRLDAVA